MIKTPNLKLPIYNTPATDKFNLEEWNSANTKIDTTYGEILNFRELIPTVNANAEIIEARQGEATLGANVIKINSKLEENIENGNLVDKLEKLIQYRGMYTRIASDSSIRVGIGMTENIKSVIEYRFVRNADGLLLLRGVYSGFENTEANRYGVTFAGTFNTNTKSQAYTTTVGDKFTFEITGKNVYFKRWCESRGGLWKFTLSNGMTRNVSCFSEIGVYKEEIVFDNLQYETYRGVAEFLGNDTINSPTATPSRGYLYYSVDSETILPMRTGKVLPIQESGAKNIVSANSVPDYAMQGKKAGSSASWSWSPVHGSEIGVSTQVTSRLFIDGNIEMTGTDVSPTYVYKEIDSFQISQKFHGINPNGVSDGSLWVHNLNHIINSRNPYLTIQNSLKTLQDVEFATGYFGMLPSRQSVVNKLILNNGLVYDTLPTIAQEDYYSSDITSGAFVGEVQSGIYHACAMDMSSKKDGYNLGKSYEPSQTSRISFRADDVTKVYFTALRASTLPANTKLTCQNRICCVTGIQAPNDSLGI